MQSIIIHEKRGNDSEGEWGRIYGRAWRIKGEGRNVIKLQSQKNKQKFKTLLSWNYDKCKHFSISHFFIKYFVILHKI